jgi:hypothetical protein
MQDSFKKYQNRIPSIHQMTQYLNLIKANDSLVQSTITNTRDTTYIYMNVVCSNMNINRCIYSWYEIKLLLLMSSVVCIMNIYTLFNYNWMDEMNGWDGMDSLS